MNQDEYRRIEAFMLSKMDDSAHDREHVYRVLYNALDIAQYETGADSGVLIAACLLHDVGRGAQFADPSICHAEEGGRMAYSFLLSEGWGEAKAARVREAVTAHRFRSDSPPQSAEAKILFDADKLEAAGALGIARTLIYAGQTNAPLYSDGGEHTFFNEYKFKLENIYDRFYTARGNELALLRRKAAADFFDSLQNEVGSPKAAGVGILKRMGLV